MRRVRSRPSSPVWRDSPQLSPQGSASSWFSPAGMQVTPPRAQTLGSSPFVWQSIGGGINGESKRLTSSRPGIPPFLKYGH